MPLCRACRQSYRFRGDPREENDSRRWDDEDHLCSFCAKAEERRKNLLKRNRRPRTPYELRDDSQRVPGLDEKLRGPLS